MDTTTETRKGSITINGTTYDVQGPTPHYGTFLLTGPRGATYLAVQAYTGDEDTLKLIGLGRGSGVYVHRDQASRAKLLEAVR